MAEHHPYAVLAEFDTPERLVEAARAIRAQGFHHIDAFTPFPVEGLDSALDVHDGAVPRAMLIGGIVGAVAGFLMQVGTNFDFPLWVGGRPLVAVPAFLLVVFELTVLFSALSGIGTMLIRNRLPRLNHPLFEVERFRLCFADRFFLALLVEEGFDRDAAGKALASLHPRAIMDVP